MTGIHIGAVQLLRSSSVTALCVALSLAGAPASVAGQTLSPESVGQILGEYAQDYALDPSLDDVTFGIEVDGAMWHIVAQAGNDTTAARVELQEGAPAQPTFYYTLSSETLGQLHRGKLNPETAMVKAFDTDPAPMEFEGTEGFQPSADFVAMALRVTFHFWTRGLPEIIPFGEAHTRFTHGADVAVFYYQPGFRSAWVSLKKGQHANADPRSQVNDFPTLLVVTSGRGTARIGGREVELQGGQAVLIPAGISHEFMNPNEEPMEGVLLMFGEGA